MNGRDRVYLALLWFCLLSSLALYLALALVLGSVPAACDSVVGFSVASGPLFRSFTRLPMLALSPAGFVGLLRGLFVALWALWGAALFALGRLSPTARARARGVILGGGAAMLAVVVVSAPPVLSADLYRQALYGRMIVAYHLNPYATPAAALAADPLFPFANHTQLTTSYGPAYTLLSALAAALAPASPLGAALAWKLMSALAALGCAALAGSVARGLGGERVGTGRLRRPDPVAGGAGPPWGPDVDDRSDGRGAELWVAWSPLLVVEAAASGHLEPIMMLPALGGLVLLQRGRPVRGTLMLLVSTMTKWVSGVLLVLATVGEVQRAAPGQKPRTLARLAGAAGLGALLLYAPFARGLATRGGIHELALGGAAPLGANMPNWLSQWKMLLGFAALTLAAAPLAARAGRAGEVAAATALMLIFIVVVVPWIFPWYFVAPLILVAVLPMDRAGVVLRVLCCAFSAIVMLYYGKIPSR